MRSIIYTAPDPIRTELRDLNVHHMLEKTSAFRPRNRHEVAGGTRFVLRTLAKRAIALEAEVQEIDAILKDLVNDTAPDLVARSGLGTDTTSALLVAAGDSPGRLRNEASFAHLCGVAPIDANTGKQQRRHRLNRGGDRQANSALWTIAICRTAADQTTRDYINRRISDGLTKKEAIRCLTAEDRDFMVDTSILSRLTDDLCDAVTGRPGGAETLARLGRSNAFVIPLDRDNRWYRYHRLFGQLVAAELHRTRPGAERSLHQRAFEWLRDNGQVAEAVPHGLAAGETDQAADLVCGHWLPMMRTGFVGRALVMRGDVDESTEYFEQVQRSDSVNERAYALAELSLGHRGRDDAERALATADTARTLMHEAGGDDLFMAATAHAAAALAALDLGDERTARVALRAAHRPMAAAGQAMPLDATHTRLLLARAALALGEPDTARQYLRDAQTVIDSVGDVGVMRQQHAELMVQLEALQTAPGDPVEEFSARELEVLAMLASPLTTREIGEELFVSRNTVKTHLRRVYRKLNVSSREEAVLSARDRGLLPAPGDRQPASG